MKPIFRTIVLAVSLVVAVSSGTALAATPKVTGASDTVCALSDAGTLSCWGDNFLGVLGDGTEVERHTAKPVIGLESGVVDFGVGGGDFACALRTDGKVLCWGSNAAGQITPGTADGNPHPTPTVVPGVSDVVSIAVAYSSVCAVRSDATAVCWGNNYYGQMGDGQPGVDATHVVTQAGVTNIARIDAANFGFCALLKDGTVSCWGMNWDGELGHGPGGFGDESSTPTVVAGLTGVVDFVGGDTACALLADSTVKCWGENTYLGLGGDVGPYAIAPVAVAGLSGVTSLEGTTDTKCARFAAGNYVCWGFNGHRQLLPTFDSGIPPTAISFGDVIAIAEGGNSTVLCWLARGGAVHCRGSNYHGEGGSPQIVNDGSPDTIVPGADAITNVYPTAGASLAVMGKAKLDKKKKTYTVTTGLTAEVPALLAPAESCAGSIAGRLTYSYKKYKRVKGKRKKVTVKKNVLPKGNLLAAGSSCTTSLAFKLPVKYLNGKRVTFSATWPGSASLAAFSVTTAKYRLPKVKAKKKK